MTANGSDGEGGGGRAVWGGGRHPQAHFQSIITVLVLCGVGKKKKTTTGSLGEHSRVAFSSPPQNNGSDEASAAHLRRIPQKMLSFPSTLPELLCHNVLSRRVCPVQSENSSCGSISPGTVQTPKYRNGKARNGKQPCREQM